MAEEKKPLSYATRFGYAAAEMGTTLSFYMISNYLSLYYLNGVGLPNAAVSGIIFVVRIIEALAAPIIGSVIDRTSTKYGQCRPWILWGTPALILFSILTFTTFDLGETGKLVYAFVSYVGLVIAFSFVDTAKSALVNNITADAQDRVTLNGWRQAFGNVMNTVLAAVTMPLILFFGNTPQAYTITTAIYAVCAVPLLLYAFFSCKETVKPVRQEGKKTSIFKNLANAFSNHQLACVIIYTLISCTAIFYRLGIMVYYYNYAWGRPELTGAVLAAFQVAQILPPFVAPFLLRYSGKRFGFAVATFGMVGSLLLLYFAGFDSIPLVFIGTFLLGFFSMGGFIGFCAVSDCIEYGYNTTGVRNPGSCVGAMTFGVKVALALGGSLGVLAIGTTGFVPNVDPTMAVRNNISFVVNIVPAIIMLVALLALIPYKLNNKEVARIQKENAAKDAELAASAEA